MTLYTLKAVDDLANEYLKLGGDVVEVVPGCLGYGTTIMYGEGLLTSVIQERYLNEWSSAHTIRQYKVMPRKYSDMIDKYYD